MGNGESLDRSLLCGWFEVAEKYSSVVCFLVASVCGNGVRSRLTRTSGSALLRLTCSPVLLGGGVGEFQMLNSTEPKSTYACWVVPGDGLRGFSGDFFCAIPLSSAFIHNTHSKV